MPHGGDAWTSRGANRTPSARAINGGRMDASCLRTERLDPPPSRSKGLLGVSIGHHVPVVAQRGAARIEVERDHVHPDRPAVALEGDCRTAQAVELRAVDGAG